MECTMAEPKFLAENMLGSFLACLETARKFANALIDGTALWKSVDDVAVEQIAGGLRSARPLNSFKSVLLPARELVARYGEGEQKDPLQEAADSTVALVGVRGCGCRALAYLDAVMLNEPPESFYRVRRENTIVISVDCAEAAPTCFCDLLGGNAYPEELFDVNLSPVESGYVAAAGSKKGSELLEKNQRLFSEATPAHLEQMRQMRQETAEQLRQQNREYTFPEDFQEDLPQSVEGMFWRYELSGCVQCGGCTAVCPTCYCFLLYDGERAPGAYERVRAWDSCQFSGYAVMAGPPGATKPDPRREHMSKFQHRFAHKFWYDLVNWGVLGCVGCGRCGQTCPGAIDLRRVLSEVKKERVEHG